MTKLTPWQHIQRILFVCFGTLVLLAITASMLFAAEPTDEPKRIDSLLIIGDNPFQLLVKEGAIVLLDVYATGDTALRAIVLAHKRADAVCNRLGGETLIEKESVKQRDYGSGLWDYEAQFRCIPKQVKP